MDRGPYLAQLIQGGQQAPQTPAAPAMPMGDLAAMVQKRKAFQAANPGGSFVGHNLAQAGRGLMAAPGNAMANLQALPGLFSLGRGR